ncbi:MAG TPA: tetratricopeptide repeat protein [Phycisphaerae bacterium]|nr:tetratricopeptide repeat protein [Phycisphaerae bacterium]
MLNAIPANAFERLMRDAQSRLAAGRPHDAAALFDQARALHPDSVEALSGLSLALLHAQRAADAVRVTEQVVALRPASAGAHANLGLALIAAGQSARAIESLLTATRLAPQWAIGFLNLGLAQLQLGRHSEAVLSLRQAAAIDPASTQTRENLVLALLGGGLPREAVAAARQAVADIPASAALHGGLLLTLHNDPAISAAQLFAEHLAWSDRHAAGVPPMPAAQVDRSPERVLRVGYVSADFRRHSVAEFFEPLLAAHDRTRVEPFCYSATPYADAMTARLRHLAGPERWRDITALSDAQAAVQVRADRIDILVDLAGHTAGNRLLLFAAQPAPVQATWLGYPDTTGVKAIAYRLTDHLADPQGAEAFSTECLWRIGPPFLCYQPPPDAAPLSELPALRTGRITFGCFGAAAKINDPLLALWTDLLHSIPGSRLLLKNSSMTDSPARERVMRFFSDRGIDAARLDLRRRSASYATHFAHYADIDIALDTFPYHGVTTTCEALWMGVPVVTCTGQTHHARVGRSLLESVGLAGLAGESFADYGQIAQRLAGDVPQLAALRRDLRGRMAASPLLDAPHFAGRIEAAYRGMWSRFIGHHPEP